jgi:hypothetical protein
MVDWVPVLWFERSVAEIEQGLQYLRLQRPGWYPQVGRLALYQKY